MRWAVARRWRKLIAGALALGAPGRALSAAAWRSKPHVCDLCGCGFDKRKQLALHVAGKRHAEAGQRAAAAKDAFLESPWAEEASADRAAAAFDMGEFLDALPTRSTKVADATTVSPRVVVGDLTGDQRAALYRYLFDAPGEIADAVAAACVAAPKQARVKELFESVEVFKVLHRRLDRGPRPARLFDLACGHGFVAHLAAAAFPATAVVAVDLEKRDAFDAWRAAFVAAGKAPCAFREESLTAVEADLDGDAMVVVVHGCDDANAVALDMAARRRSAWLVVPCCLKAPNYLDRARTDRKSSRSPTAVLDDETRYALLCGALAHKYGADLTTMVDRRVTGRHLVLAGRGGGADAPPPPPPPGRLPTFRGPHVAAP